MRAAAVVAEMTLRELGRRRAVVVLLVVLPLAFYLARRDLPGQSVRLLTMGLGWAVATLALFSTVAARDLDRRLRASGARVRDLVGGRVAAVLVVGGVLAGLFALLVAVDQDVVRPGGVVLGLLAVVAVGAPLGTALGAVLPRELEGSLALLVVLATQLLSDPAGGLASALPFWVVGQVGAWSVDGAPDAVLVDGLSHAAAAVGVLALAGGVAAAVRLRVVRLDEPGAETLVPGMPEE